MHTDVDAQKRALRAELRERRRNLTAVEREQSQFGLTEGLIALLTELDARSCSAYLPTTDEPDITGFLDWAREHDVRVLVPRSRDDGLLDWGELSNSALEQGKFGIVEPTGERLSPLAVNDVDVMIVPASSVDRRGMRLGWGRGYFDRTLGSMASRPPVYAVVYDHELVDDLPSEVHDQAVDGVVTPSHTRRFPKVAGR